MSYRVYIVIKQNSFIPAETHMLWVHEETKEQYFNDKIISELMLLRRWVNLAA